MSNDNRHESCPLGYDPKILLNPKKYLCGICKLIFNTPVQNQCGHRFCEACLQSAPDGSLCPSCAEEGEEEEEDTKLKPDSRLPDFAIRKELRREKAKCLHKGCDWAGKFIQYDEHAVNCEFKVKSCQFGCDAVSNKEHRESHVQQHLSILLQKIHEIKGNASISSRRNSPGTNEPAALNLLQNKLATCETSFEALRRKLEGINDPPAIADSVNSYNPTTGSTITQIPNTTGPFSSTTPQRKRVDIPERPDVAVAACGYAINPPTTDAIPSLYGGTPQTRPPLSLTPIPGPQLQTKPPNLEPSVATLKEKVDTIEALLAVVNAEIEEVIRSTAQAHRVTVLNKDTIERLRTKMEQLQMDVARKDVSLAEKELRLRHLELTGFDGTLVWQVAEFSRKRAEAMTGSSRQIYSPMFHTGRAGYKLNASLFPNGDGLAKGTHMSLFIVLWRGLYDAILPWPFRLKVTLKLLDQKGKNHVTHSFVPDRNQPAFRRPQSERNIASGVPLFCPLSKLQDTRNSDYVKDDSLFLKVIIDTQ